MTLQEIFLSELEKRLELLPFTKHLDDGQYNDGVVTGFEMGADWVYTSHVEPLQKENERLTEMLNDSIEVREILENKIDSLTTELEQEKELVACRESEIDSLKEQLKALTGKSKEPPF